MKNINTKLLTALKAAFKSLDNISDITNYEGGLPVTSLNDREIAEVHFEAIENLCEFEELIKEAEAQESNVLPPQKEITYFVFGEDAVDKITCNDEELLMLPNNNITFVTYEFIQGETRISDALFEFGGWGEYLEISKELYDKLNK